MKKPVFTGAAVAIVTPMHADGSINYEELGRMIGAEIDKKKVELPSSIKEFGSYDAQVRLYAGVAAGFKVKVEEL